MITIELNQAEIHALAALIDAAIKANGLPAAKAGLPIIEKLEAAVAEVNQSNVVPIQQAANG